MSLFHVFEHTNLSKLGELKLFFYFYNFKSDNMCVQGLIKGHKRGKALSIRTSEPTLNQIAKILYTKVTHTIIALLKGLEYTLTFSIMHKQIIIGTKITISLTPIPLEVTIRNKLKHSRKYHSGTISNGVEKAFEQDIISKGQAIDKPNISTPKPYIRTANMYTISFGHAASP